MRANALNRGLLEDAFPLELADRIIVSEIASVSTMPPDRVRSGPRLALGIGDGTASLTRCTVLGRIDAG